jgi:hypothetical protein
MAIVVKDRVKVTFTTTGTADFTLGAAATGFQSFAAIGNTNFTYYAAVDPATGDWEVGYGQYLTAGPTLTRNTILSSSAAGAKVSFGSGSKDVFCTYPSEKAIYEEYSGNVLIDGGPITVIGTGVTSYTTFSAALAELYANINSFAQLYAQNLNSGSDASTDIVAYNNLGDGNTNFIDMGISSSNYTSATYPIFTPSSGYVYNDGGELIIGSATNDVVLFAGGVATTDEAVRINKTSKLVTTKAGLSVGTTLGVTGAATFGSTVLLNANPTLNLQAATKQYVDQAAATGFTVHSPVVYATTAALATNTYNNGASGVGATLTAVANGALSVDGNAVTTSQRILVKDEVTQANNGVYTVTQTGSGILPYILTRATDFDQAAAGEIANNAYFYVTSGTANIGRSFILSQTAAITVGTTSLPFTLFNDQLSYVGGTNISVAGQTISLTGTVAPTNGGTGVNTVTTGDLLYGSATNTWSKLPKGAAYKSLVMNAGGTQVEWNAVALDQAAATSGALPATSGGTGLTTYTVGDTLYSGTTNALTKLAGNITTTKKFLGQTGTGAASAAPIWQQPAASDITGLATSATTDTTNANNITSGTLGTARLSGSYTGITGVGTLAAGTWNGSTIAATYGGTGQSSYAVGDLVYADTTTTLAKLADVATGNALISGGVGAAPSYGKIGLATHVSGTLPIANGGTGSTSTTFVNLASNVTGTLPVGNGGTGAATFTANNVLLGNGTSAFQVVAPGTTGNVLQSNGTTWTSAAAPSTMVYPAAGIPNSTGTAWGTSYSTSGTGTVVALTTSPSFTTPVIGAATGTSLSVSGQLTSTVATGTAPLVVSSTTQVANLNVATAGTANALNTANSYTVASLTSTGGVSGTTGLFSGQGRFSGWYTSGTGVAAEIGISGGDAYLISYNRTTAAYSNLEIDATNIRLAPQGGTLTGPGGNVILHAGNYNSYAPTLTGTGASGTWGINVTGNAANVTGTVAVGNGGTGTTSLTLNNVLLGNGTAAPQFVAPSTSGNVLTSNGTTWTSAAAAGGFAAGTAILFYQAAAPTGWTKATTQDNKGLRVVSGATGGSAGGTTAFSTVFTNQTPTGTVAVSLNNATATNQAQTAGGSVTLAAGGSVSLAAGGSVNLSAGGSVSNSTLSTAQLASHSHSGATYSSGAAAYEGGPGGADTGTGAAGSGASHGHGFTNPTYSFTNPSYSLNNPSYSFGGTSHNHTQDAHVHSIASQTFTGSALTLNLAYIDVIICTKN